MSTVGKRFVLKRHFEGLPKPEDFDLVEEKLSPLQDGEILISALYLSVDPYMRPYTKRMTPPFTMIGQGVYKVLASKDEKFPTGSIVLANSGWIKQGILNHKKIQDGALGSSLSLFLAPDLKGLSPSLLLGACGMPGNTAYFGFLEICQPKEGETVVINGAAGAVGSLVGQIAKLKGCRVIGFAGSDDKCQFLCSKLGFDHAYNYKKVNDSTFLRKYRVVTILV